jgi:hypothetical protein
VEELFRQALIGQEKVLGMESPETQESLKNLAKCKRNKGNDDEAKVLEKEYAEKRAGAAK